MSIVINSLTAVDTTPMFQLGTEYEAPEGKVYKYLKGVASTVLGSVVTFNGSFATALSVANAVGEVAVALGATVADTYGWYQVEGTGTAKVGTVAANVACYLTATPGVVDDAVAAGDLIVGMFTRSTDTTGLATVQLSRPVVTDKLG